MLDGDAFGPACRTGCIDHVSEVLRRHIAAWVFFAFRVRVHSPKIEVFKIEHFCLLLGQKPAKASLGHQHGGPSVFQNKGQPFCGISGIQWDVSSACFQNSEHRHNQVH